MVITALVSNMSARQLENNYVQWMDEDLFTNYESYGQMDKNDIPETYNDDIVSAPASKPIQSLM